MRFKIAQREILYNKCVSHRLGSGNVTIYCSELIFQRVRRSAQRVGVEWKGNMVVFRRRWD